MMAMEIKNKIIAIDWDGTIVENGYFPEIGVLKPNAINVIKRIINEGGQIIIWTCRGGEKQYKAIKNKLNENGVYDFIINDHSPDMLELFEKNSPKVFADLYIDDRSLHAIKKGGIDWYEIEKMLFEDDE